MSNALDELNKQKEEVNTQLNDAEKELIDAREEIAKIEKPTWYVLDRDQNRGYASFIQDTESVANIGRVFPIVFFIVATLISLTSMTRMVEEQRTQIGTLKALGYNKIHIAGKYVLYASLASVIGSILGMCVGFVLIPTVIWNMYSTMYEIGDISLELQLSLLTVIDEGIYYRVGSSKPCRNHARLLFATNADLEDKISKKLFREDLYYRIQAFTVTIPPLRERLEEIPQLIDDFLLGSGKHLSMHALNKLYSYEWPGNVRELKNRIRRAVRLSEGDEILLSFSF